MSRGLGNVAKSIADALRADPENAFTTEDLCEIAFLGVNRLEKKHTVSVLRAMHRVLVDFPSYRVRVSSRRGNTLVLLNGHSPLSIGMSFFKLASYGRYRLAGPKGRTEQDLRQMLAPGGVRHSWVQPGGDYWLAAQFWTAEDAGDEGAMMEIEQKFVSIKLSRRQNPKPRPSPKRVPEKPTAFADDPSFATWVAEGRKLAAMLYGR